MRRRPVRREARARGSASAPSLVERRRERARRGRRPVGGPRVRAEGVRPDEAVPAPSLVALGGLEEEPGPVARERGEGRDGRQRVGDDLDGDGHDRVARGEALELRRATGRSPPVR